MGKVYIIGSGPGHPGYFLPLARSILSRADFIIADGRLFSFIPKGKRRMRIERAYRKALEYIKKNASDKNIAVLVSGDPGVFSFAKSVVKVVSPAQLEVIPGISSLQLACSRLGCAWDDLCIASVHGKSLRGVIEKVEGNKRVMLFCDPKNTPSRIAGYLAGKGTKKKKLTALGNLSLSAEEIIRSDVTGMIKLKREWKGLWLLLIEG
ncbi:MAG: precorrin-6y C5,15-methyltransferase (decarboxylating) subunit CbiE [Candidatus Omnitrophota bacterium]|nr:precorrin-6y C5,15-methyltransferase (decarboxylating) subunit CbiE [Candidatus Omnitrophota bacterium]